MNDTNPPIGVRCKCEFGDMIGDGYGASPSLKTLEENPLRIGTAKTAPTILSLVIVNSLFSLSVQADEKHREQPTHQLPAWTQSLTPSQRETIEHMHHELEVDQATHKKKEAEALKELNEMTIREDVELADVNAKIDELMAAKNQIMRLRYDHLIAMRRVLSDEQKVGYDKGVLKRSAIR